MYSSFKKIINTKEIKRTSLFESPGKYLQKRLNQGKTASINCSRYIISPVGCTAPCVQPTCFLSRAHLMSMSLMFLIFSSLCTKVTMSNWSCWLRRVGHAEGRKKRKKQARPFGQWELKKGILVEAKSK